VQVYTPMYVPMYKYTLLCTSKHSYVRTYVQVNTPMYVPMYK